MLKMGFEPYPYAQIWFMSFSCVSFDNVVLLDLVMLFWILGVVIVLFLNLGCDSKIVMAV